MTDSQFDAYLTEIRQARASLIRDLREVRPVSHFDLAVFSASIAVVTPLSLLFRMLLP